MVTKDEAKRYMCDVAPEQCFWVNNGPVLKNLEELSNALADIGDDTFRHHVNKEKNDFTNWIKDIIGDQKLANDLLSSKNRQSAIKKVSNRLNALKRKMG